MDVRISSWKRVVVVVVAALTFLVPNLAGADGTESLGPPSVGIAAGTGIVVGGTGLISQPANLAVSVPAGSAVAQVLLYWEGQHRGPAGDDTIVIDGTEVTGTLIGGPTFFFNFGGDVMVSAYRADITHLGLVGAGANSLTVSGASFDSLSNGAGLVVIVDDGGPKAEIDLRDGADLAYHLFPEPRRTTVPQTFTFAAEAADRTADLAMMAASVGHQRPNSILITLGDGTSTKIVNPFGSTAGDEFDALTIPVAIPAGETQVTVQAISESDGTTDQPASLSWIVGGLSVPITPPPPPPPPPLPGEGVGTPGYWKNHPDAWPVQELEVGGVTLTQAEAIAILDNPAKGDATNILARHLVAALLNVAAGSDPSCVVDEIAAAQDFLVAHPVGSGLKTNDPAWQSSGGPLAEHLDAYNNGELCAPSRG